MAAFNSDLNPNAHPFQPLDSPSKKEYSLSIPTPIFNLSHHRKTIPTQPPFHLLPGDPSPLHGYVYFLEPNSRRQFHYPIFNSQACFPPSSGNFQAPDFRHIANMGPRKSTRKFKFQKKTEPEQTSNLPSPVAGEGISIETTTVMVKNIPNQFRRHDLLNILDKHCRMENRWCNGFGSDRCMSEYDFVYLPMDFWRYWVDRKVSNLGYAFVNFTTAAAASKFCDVFHRREWEVTLNKKVCEVTRAKIQGMKALGEAFRNKIFWCHSIQYLPVKLEPPSDGGRQYRAISIGKRVPHMPPKHINKCC